MQGSIWCFFSFSSNTYFSCFYAIVPRPTHGPSPVNHEKGWRARGRRSATLPVWICQPEIQTEATFALHILSQAKIFHLRFSDFFRLLHTSQKKDPLADLGCRWQRCFAVGWIGITVCVWHLALCCKWYVSNNHGGDKTKQYVCSLMQVGICLRLLWCF